MPDRRRFVVVIPVRNERRFIGLTIESLAKQRLRPLRCVIVDDGSSDGTEAITDEWAARVPWLSVVHLKDRGFRAPGGGVMTAFYAGFELVREEPWDFVVKLDGDLSFEPDYFERCLAHFALEPSLGIGGGTVCAVDDGRVRVESVGDPPFHVRGATKIYRRDCWLQIEPLVRAPGWDTLDEVRANRHGWATRSFPELFVVQHKPTGSADGHWANAFKNGKANYLTGYHPLFMFAKCIKRVARRPYGVESAALMSGFLSGYLKRQRPLADKETVRYLRAQQVRRMLQQPSIYG